LRTRGPCLTARPGRWLSADWSAAPAPVPYANLTNPQTLNLYAMVRDNPESFADLDGHLTAAQAGGSASLMDPNEFDMTFGIDSPDQFCAQVCTADDAPSQDAPQTHQSAQDQSQKTDDASKAVKNKAGLAGLAGVALTSGVEGAELGPADIVFVAGVTAVYLYRNRDTWNYIIIETKNFLEHVDLTQPGGRNPDPGNRSKWRRDLKNKLDNMQDKTKRLSPRLQQWANQIIDELRGMIGEE
jgi:hypothetical protein